MKNIILSILLLLVICVKSQTVYVVDLTPSIQFEINGQTTDTILNTVPGDVISFITSNPNTYMVGVEFSSYDSIYYPVNINNSATYIIQGGEIQFLYQDIDSQNHFTGRSGWFSSITVNINNNQLQAHYSINNNVININYTELTPINIYTIDGRLIISEKIKTGNLNLENLSNGIYILDINGLRKKIYR